MNEFSSQIVITRSPATFTQLNTVRSNTFTLRDQELDEVEKYRDEISVKIEEYLNQTAEVLETNVNRISSADSSLQTQLSSMNSSDCIKNLINSMNSYIADAGYGVSNCVTDSDQTVLTAIRGFLGYLDQQAREFNIVPSLIISSLSGRNIFTQSRPIITRATALFNIRSGTFSDFQNAIAPRLSDVVKLYEDEIKTFNSCTTAIGDFIDAKVVEITGKISVCQVFISRNK